MWKIYIMKFPKSKHHSYHIYAIIDYNKMKIISAKACFVNLTCYTSFLILLIEPSTQTDDKQQTAIISIYFMSFVNCPVVYISNFQPKQEIWSKQQKSSRGALHII